MSTFALAVGCEGNLHEDIVMSVGNDVRKAVLDGFPPENVVASDLKQRLYLA